MTGIQLLGIVLANDLPPYTDSREIQTVPEQQFFHALTDNFYNKYKDVYAPAGEVDYNIIVLF